MAKVIRIGEPANEAERQAIRFLRERLPDSWLIFHNFEMRQREQVFEIDIAIVATHAVYLVDVKATGGRIDVWDSMWYPEGRQQFPSPLAKLRNHAKIMASIIRDSDKGLPDLHNVYVHATVLLTAADAKVVDGTGRDGPDVTDFKRGVKYFHDPSGIPQHRRGSIARFHSQIRKAITGKAKPRSGAPVFRDWRVEERLGGTDRYTEYRAKHDLLGESGMARLRVYEVDPYQDKAARKAERNKIINARRVVADIPVHANVLAVTEVFATDDEGKVVLVTEDLRGQVLRLHMANASLALTLDQKLQVMRDVLSALDHVHGHEVIHRNLTSDAILVAEDGRAKLTGFDVAVGKDRISTIADQVADDPEATYRAPECLYDPDRASMVSDLYAAGLIFYELLTGERPPSVDQIMESDGRLPLKPSEHKPDLPKGMDEWLQKFCEFDPEERHASAAIGREVLDELILPEARNDSGSNAGSMAEVAREFEVRETSTGRFHLAGFGAEYGGSDRDESFIFVVRDRHGCEVARSLPCTARQLSIAERGRRDYDANRFHQSDFFKRDAGGGPIPHSAIARRARWTQ